MREEIDASRRAYVVCPRIEGDQPEDDAEPDPMDDDAFELDIDGAPAPPARPPLEAVVDVAERLRGLPAMAGIDIGVMHGRLTGEQKDAAMAAFASGSTPILVSTTVIEVGVDVPQASTMVVLDAEHFGMSQLHQLRGRVGRASEPGLCLLVSHAQEGTPALERLTAVAATSDGFALAEKDLELRREGDVLGAAQSGGRNSLRLLRVVRDADVLATARADARQLVDADPTLAGAPALARAILGWLGEREDFLERT
jgi:ATP-dependent DNA helicase RecG